MNKVLLLPKYPRLGASSRVRSYQYIPLYESNGVEVTVSPFFNLPYLQSLYSHKRPGIGNVLFRYMTRLLVCLKVFKYDLVIIEKEVFPYFPAIVEKLFSKFGVRFVVDYDDAIFHNYDKHSSGVVVNMLGDKIDQVMKCASGVWVGNDYLAQRAKAAGSAKIMHLPTSVDISKYKLKDHQEGFLPVIGWVGSPTTIKYLRAILPVLEQLRQQVPFKLMVIGQQCELNYSGELEIVDWQEDREGEQLLSLDIGLMPLPDSAWEQGKCSYKLIQYMAAGLPVVASPVGMNKKVVDHGTNGFLAQNDADWIKYLTLLIQDVTLRNQMGLEGRRLVEAEYTIERNWEKIMGFFELKEEPKELVNP
ncbi:glycosyltransferase family 4 protein [Litoribacter ruber]|uniref:glycosyltransferase family 4 protein n=1 Tax=Litoribacter ruber TaxID=702568 RepID=UPI001BD98206|nr:glycosyltransferase family 4 protein [Litoribacter ruber]MBT0813052.1 glycosyltransferase family 4 protein [Litoribacter ruber]